MLFRSVGQDPDRAHELALKVHVERGDEAFVLNDGESLVSVLKELIQATVFWSWAKERLGTIGEREPDSRELGRV